MNGKPVAIVIAPENFRDEEFFVSKQQFENAGFPTVVASTQIGTATGMLGGKVNVLTLIPDLRAENLAALVIIGGEGSKSFLFDSAPLHKLAKKLFATGKPIGAICTSPGVFAKAGLLQGKRATIFKSQTTLKLLKDAGATFVGQDCVVDGMIVTANGPGASEAFSTELVQLLMASLAHH